MLENVTVDGMNTIQIRVPFGLLKQRKKKRREHGMLGYYVVIDGRQQALGCFFPNGMHTENFGQEKCVDPLTRRVTSSFGRSHGF